MKRPTFSDLSSEIPADKAPWLDGEIKKPYLLTHRQRSWRDDGLVILPAYFAGNVLLEKYRAAREAFGRPGGWPCDTPYMHSPSLRALALHAGLNSIMRDLIGANMGLHLNLTGWVSTQRDWHQDDYLNPDFVNSWYCAAWIALEDINPDSGPFQYVPGSNRWNVIRREKVLAAASPLQRDEKHWPNLTQGFVSDACEDEIRRTNSIVETFYAKAGDVLIWSGRLVHRGSVPNVPGTPRRSLIAHYSAITHRPDMPEPVLFESDDRKSRGYYFPISQDHRNCSNGGASC